MTLGKNAQLNNASPIEKADGFQNSTLLSQKEVGDTIKANSKWSEAEIKERQNRIIEFALDYWQIEH